MSDFKLLEKDGYVELEDVSGAMGDGLDILKLWSAVGQGETKQAAEMLLDVGYGEEDEVPESFQDIVVIAVPDDWHGKFYRIWVKSSDKENPKRRR